MIGLIRFTLALAATVLIAPALAQAAEQVDLLLVLASDVSRSVDHPKFLLQREGYAAAISDPHVLDAIRSGPHQRIALCFVEWSGFGAQKLVIDWSLIDAAGRRANSAISCWSYPAPSPTALRSAAASSSQPNRWSTLPMRLHATPSTSQVPAPTMPAAT